MRGPVDDASLSRRGGRNQGARLAPSTHALVGATCDVANSATTTGFAAAAAAPSPEPCSSRRRAQKLPPGRARPRIPKHVFIMTHRDPAPPRAVGDHRGLHRVRDIPAARSDCAARPWAGSRLEHLADQGDRMMVFAVARNTTPSSISSMDPSTNIPYRRMGERRGVCERKGSRMRKRDSIHKMVEGGRGKENSWRRKGRGSETGGKEGKEGGMRY